MEASEWGERTAAIILAHRHRRFLLSHLNGQDGALTVEGLATDLLAWERRQTDGDATDTEHHALCVQLHHEHLPRLDDAGVLSYDWEQQLVTEWRHPNLGDEWFEDVALGELIGVIDD